MLKGKVPVVIVRHDDATEDIYGTVTQTVLAVHICLSR